MSSAEERRAFLERSLVDLEEEHDAGDLDDDDYVRLRADYERRLAVLEGRARPTRPERKAPPPRPARTVAIAALVLLAAIGSGILVARSSGRRDVGDSITGADLSTRTTVPAGLQECLDLDAASEAATCFIEYRRAHPDDPHGAFRMGLFSINQGLLAGSEELLDTGENLLRDALDLDPGFDAARVNLATYLARTDRPDDAREVLAPLEGEVLPPELQALVDAITPILEGSTTTTTAAGSGAGS